MAAPGAIAGPPQQLILQVYANAAPAKVQAFVSTLDGTQAIAESVTFTANRSLETFRSSKVPAGGPLVDGAITGSVVGIERGQVFVRALFGGRLIAQGYLYEGNDYLPLGTFVEPGSGKGYRRVETLISDGAPVATTAFALGVTNAIRRYLGFIWYYVASTDAATRTAQCLYRRPFGALPTGFPTDNTENVWESPILTLTVSEEGSLFAYSEGGKDGYSGSNDSGTIAIQNHTTAPQPFPILAREDDPGLLRFALGSGNANDLNSLYVIYDEWVGP